MKVRMVVTLDVDMREYQREYGEYNVTQQEFREGIKDAVYCAIIADGIIYPNDSKIIKSVEVK